ncbi:MAG: hypothetical protein HYV02_03675 [Deltaproteobacteria bacterium]|nr:hypothetical protein [Deltaproteobacteria bacterium]
MVAAQSKWEWSQEAPGREKVWFFLMLGLIVYLCYIGVWGPQRARSHMVREKIDTAKVQLETLEKILSVKIEKKNTPLASAPVGIQPDDPRFQPYLSGEMKGRHAVLKEVSEVMTSPAVLREMELLQMRFEEEQDKGDYLEIPFELRLEGSYRAMTHYFFAVESAPILAIIRGIDLVSPKIEEGRLQATLSGAAFVIKSAAALQTPTGGK